MELILAGQFVGLPSVPRGFTRWPTLSPSYCCLLLPRGIRKSFGVNEKAGRGGGDRIHQGAESKGTLRIAL